MSRMVVEDVTDDCKTILSPARFMDDIYRIWCETSTVPARYGNYPYDMYFENEYKDYPNPEIDFGNSMTKEWTAPDSEKFELDISMLDDVELTQTEMDRIDNDTSMTPEQKDEAKQKLRDDKEMEAFKALLDDYYVSVLRTDKAQILNEKRYLLPPTPISQFVLGMGSENGYMKCNLSPYQTSLVKDNHYVKTQVMFVGTPDPFSYDNDGNRIYSRPEEMQYGNCLKGVDQVWLKVDITTQPGRKFVYDKRGNIVVGDDDTPVTKVVTRKFLLPTIRFHKFVSQSTQLTERLATECKKIPEGSVMVVFSHKNLDNIAKYHILNRQGNLYYDGSLPKNWENQYKYSDFKFETGIRTKFRMAYAIQMDGGYFRELDDGNVP